MGFNETEENEYINLRHGTTGAYIKMYANGDIQVHTPIRDVNVIAARHINVKTGTRLDSQDPSKSDRFVLNVTGNVHLDIEGDMHTNIKGNRYTTINGEDNLTIKGPALYNYSELGENITGDHKCEASKSITVANNIQRDLKKGGLMKDSFAGTYIIEQTSRGGVLQFKSEGDMQIDVKGHIRTTVQSNSINNITGKVEWNVRGKRVLGSPTGLSIGSLGASTPSFNVTTASGKINISAAGQFGMDCGSTSLFDSGGNMKLEAPRIDLN